MSNGGNGAFAFHINDTERHSYYIGIISHMRRAIEAKMDHDEDTEREECVMALDLLSEVMGA